VAATIVLSAMALLASTYVTDTPPAQAGVTRTATVDRAPLVPFGRSGVVDSGPLALAHAPLPTDDHAGRLALLVGFGLIALATLLISVLYSLGFPSWALLTLACALAAEVGMTFWDAAPFSGAALLTGAAVAVVVATPPVVSLFLRPGRVLATILWIS
jgi:hypothetical protein